MRAKDKAFENLAEAFEDATPESNDDGKLEELENKIAEKLDKRVDDMLSKWEEKINKLTTNKDGADAPESPEDNNNDESEDNENGDN